MRTKEFPVYSTLDFLNDLLARDSDAITQLLVHRIPVNARLASHPTVLHERDYLTTRPEIGFLGILNGLIAALDSQPYTGQGRITARFDENDHCFGFYLTETD